MSIFGRLVPSFDGPRYVSPYFYVPPKRRWWPFLAVFAGGGVAALVAFGPSQQSEAGLNRKPIAYRIQNSLANGARADKPARALASKHRARERNDQSKQSLATAPPPAEAVPGASRTQVAAAEQRTDEAQVRQPEGQSVSGGQIVVTDEETKGAHAADPINETGATASKTGKRPPDAGRFTRSDQHRPGKTAPFADTGPRSLPDGVSMSSGGEVAPSASSSRSAERGNVDLTRQPTATPPRHVASRSARRGEQRVNRERRMDEASSNRHIARAPSFFETATDAGPWGEQPSGSFGPLSPTPKDGRAVEPSPGDATGWRQAARDVEGDSSRPRNWNNREGAWGIQSTDQAWRGSTREQRQSPPRRLTNGRGHRDARWESDWGWNDWRGAQAMNSDDQDRGAMGDQRRPSSRRFSEQRSRHERRESDWGWSSGDRDWRDPVRESGRDVIAPRLPRGPPRKRLGFA